MLFFFVLYFLLIIFPNLFFFCFFLLIRFWLIASFPNPNHTHTYLHTHPFLGYTPSSAGHVRNRSESVETVNPLTLNDLTDGRRRHRIRRYLVRYLPHHLTPPTTTPQSPSSPVVVIDDDDDEDHHNELTLDLDTTPTTTSATTTPNIITTTVTTVPPPGPAPSILPPTFSDVISTSTPSTTHEHRLVGTVQPSVPVPVSPATIAHHHLVLRDETTSSIDDAAVDAAGSWQDSLKRQRETDARQIESRLMDSIHHHHHHGTASEAGSIDVARFSHFLESALTRTRIGYHSSSSSVSSIHAASAAAAAAAANVANNHNNNSSSSTSYYSTSSSYNTSGSSNASSSNHSRF